MTNLDAQVEELKALLEKCPDVELHMQRGYEAPLLATRMGGTLATANIGTVPYRNGIQDCGDAACDCWMIAAEAEALFEFTALAHNLLPALLAEREEMKKRIEELEGWYEDARLSGVVE